ASAIKLVFPELEGKMEAVAMRVPTADVSVVDFAVEVDNPTTAQEVNAKFKEAAEGDLKGYLRYSDEELVSSDFIGDPHSAIFDAPLTSVVQGNLVKVIGWYDNEYGYSSRVIDLIEYVRDSAK
ncbi:MAG: type I glyceraldehyde-3-phosphate dehydrogenase, partial [Thermodesulfobacteriota bacterium]